MASADSLPSPKFLSGTVEVKDICASKSKKPFLMPGLVGSGLPRIATFPKHLKGEFTPPEDPVPKRKYISQKAGAPHFSSAEGMLLPSSMQPPPMYGPRGPTIPPKYLAEYQKSQCKIEDDCWCEICDEGFTSGEELEKHKRQHKLYGEPSSKVENAQANDLYSEIRKLNTPQEIAKWRDERRKKYPMSANVELRRKVQEAKMKRGERIEKKKSRFGNKHDKRPIRNNDGERVVLRKKKTTETLKIKKRDMHKPKPKPASKCLDNEMESELHFNRKLPAFKGTSAMEDYTRPILTPKKYNPLANLLGMYGSDDDTDSDAGSDEDCSESCSRAEAQCKPNAEEQIVEKNNVCWVSLAVTLPENESTDDEAPEEIPAKRIKETFECESNVADQIECASSNMSSFKPAETDKEASSNADAPDGIPAKEIKTNVEDEMPRKKQATQPKSREMPSSKKRIRRRGTKQTEQTEAQPAEKELKKTLLDYSKLRTSRQNTLLEKLLEPDIRHERNVLLQCVRYVVENNFFGIGSKRMS